MSGMAMLLAGVIGGAVFSSIVWAIVVAGKSGALAKRKRAREELMSGVAELLAQADTLQASFRGGSVKRQDFARDMSKLVGAISSMVRVNMNNLDVFFVKYADQQVEEYMRLIENPERRRHVAPESAQDEGAVDLDVDPVVPASDQPRSFADDDAVDLPPPDADIVPIGVDVAADDPPVDEDAFDVSDPVADEADASGADTDQSADDAVASDADEPVIDTDVLDRFASADAAADVADGVGEFGADTGGVAAKQAADDSWADKTDDEYAAEFEQFEEQADGASVPDVPVDTTTATFEVPSAVKDVVVEPVEDDGGAKEDIAGDDADKEVAPRGEVDEEVVLEDEDDDHVFDVFSAPESAPAHVAAQVPEDEDLELAETISFDRSTLADIVAAAGGGPTYARAPISAPDEGTPKSAPAVPPAAGITGDDVGNAIDDFFKLK